MPSREPHSPNAKLITTWCEINKRHPNETRKEYFARFLGDNPTFECGFSLFAVYGKMSSNKGRYGVQGGGQSIQIREWQSNNPKQDKETANEWHKRCQQVIPCKYQIFYYCSRYTPYETIKRRDLTAKTTFFTEGQTLTIYSDYRDINGRIEGKARLVRFVEQGLPLIIKGVFVAVEIWEVDFIDFTFSTRRKLLCVEQ